MTSTSNSRHRMLAALACQEPDFPPCSFMLFNGLKERSTSYLDFIQRQLDLGLDACVQLPPRPPLVVSDTYNLHGLPVSFHPEVTLQESKTRYPGSPYPLLVKEYHTPAGVLRTEVNQDEEWPYGDHVPFLDDYLETRSRRFLVEGLGDLPALRYLLQPPSQAEIAEFFATSAPLLEFARQRQLLVTGGWGVGADMVGWLYGLENMILASYEQPDFLRELLGLIAAWNHERMRLVLSAGPDLYIKRAWYENTDFWSPRSWKKFILPLLQTDVALCHAAGARFGYLITASCMPLLEMIAEAGVDVLIGVDPARWDLAEAKRRLNGRVCLWGGVNGHLTVEQGSPAEVRAEVRSALQLLSPGGGFILSPVDNVRRLTPEIEANVAALIEEWQGWGDRSEEGFDHSASDL
jgi:hypothetical protein